MDLNREEFSQLQSLLYKFQESHKPKAYNSGSVPIDRAVQVVIDYVGIAAASCVTGGAFTVNLSDVICSSCFVPLYSVECPHYPGQKDEMGNIVTVTINRVKVQNEP